MTDDEQAARYAVIYAAKSTDDVRGSIPAQIEKCKALCAREGFAVSATYSDEAVSAYHGSRGDGLARARKEAERLAAEHGRAVLVALHSDRLSRGDGVSAAHLVEYVLWAMNAGVTIRTVQDDRSCESILDAALMGLRNHEDSKRKSMATAEGRRRAAERGDCCGAVPDGYEIERTPQGATIVRRVVMHAERREVYRLLWEMKRNGATDNDIVREFRARGYRTAPRKGRPRPFDATRVGKVIVNPFYAGLMTYHKKIIGPGNWPAYIEPDDWHRIRRERSERARHRPNPVGRPPTGLLARLVRCECGGTMIQQRHGARKDGTRRRVYTCQTHMHGAGACDTKPFDAEEVERLVLGGLDGLLADAGSWADALLAGREAERRRLAAEAEAAATDVVECERQIEQLAGRYDNAVAAGNEAAVELAERAWKTRREAAQRAEVRRQAAEDALAAVAEEPIEDADGALARMWQSLSGDLDAVKGERAALNETLRRYFSDFILRRENGELRIVPVLTPEAMWRGLRDALDDKPSKVCVRAYAVDLDDPEDAVIRLEVSGPPR